MQQKTGQCLTTGVRFALKDFCFAQGEYFPSFIHINPSSAFCDVSTVGGSLVLGPVSRQNYLSTTCHSFGFKGGMPPEVNASHISSFFIVNKTKTTVALFYSFVNTKNPLKIRGFLVYCEILELFDLDLLDDHILYRTIAGHGLGVLDHRYNIHSCGHTTK